MSITIKPGECPICDGATCAVCDYDGREARLFAFVPWRYVSNPYVLFSQDDLILFVRRVYNAAPGASRQQVRDLVESLYIAAEHGSEVGYAAGLNSASHDARGDHG
jgi:hypothetical protein